MSFGWWYTATPQECRGCGRTDETVHATTRRCMPCDGVDLSAWPRPVALSPSVVALARPVAEGA